MTGKLSLPAFSTAFSKGSYQRLRYGITRVKGLGMLGGSIVHATGFLTVPPQRTPTLELHEKEDALSPLST